MLTFEKVLKVFQVYLDDDPLYAVVQTSHGYTLMAWEPHRNDWYSADIQKTPDDLRNALLGTYANFLEDKITGNDRDLTVTETEKSSRGVGNFWKSAGKLDTYPQKTASLKIITGYLYFCMPISFVLLSWVKLINIVHDIQTIVGKTYDGGEAE
jgi:hypothetical protein